MRKLKKKPAVKAKPAAEEPTNGAPAEEFKVDELPHAQPLRWLEVQCPYCGEDFEVRVDPSEEGQSMIQDCQVCCKPVQVAVEVEEGEVEVFAYRS